MTSSVPLTFDVPGRVLHCPMVAATIGGCATNLIVDTGATSHILTRDFVERAGLEVVATAPGRDVAGDAVSSWSIGDVVAEIGSLSSTLQEVVAIDGPEPFHEWDVGGFLSPQRLAEDATVVLDLAAERLDVEADDADAVSARLLHRLGELVPLEGAQHVAGTLGFHLRVLPAEPVVAFLDTGAAETEVAAVAVEGAVDGPVRSGGAGVGGSAITLPSLKDQQLEVGRIRFRVEHLGVRDTIPAPDDAPEGEIPLGLIGMDLLRGTIIVIAPRRAGRVWWYVSADDLIGRV